MAPYFLPHDDNDDPGPYWSVVLHVIAVFIFGSILYLAREARREQQELDRLARLAMSQSPSHYPDDKDGQLVQPPESDTPAAPPLFLLVGDSTTAAQSAGGGGWGTGFLSLLARGAHGINYGRNGATTRDYIKYGIWDEVLDQVRKAVSTSPVHVTIQFGHNDQMPSRGVSLDDYRQLLVRMARDVLDAGAVPILLSPLTRRDFDADGTVVDNLREYRHATHTAFQEVASSLDSASGGPRPRFCDLNAASLAYVAALGRDAAQQYNLTAGDTTHLSLHGSTVFGRMVADLLLGHPPALVKSGHRDKWAPGCPKNDDGGIAGWIKPSPLLSGQIWHGLPA